MGAVVLIGLILFFIIKVAPEIERDQRWKERDRQNWNEFADRYNKSAGKEVIKKH